MPSASPPLEAQGAFRQRLTHKQGFSTVPVDDILDRIKDKLPAIKDQAGVTALISKWDKAAPARHPAAKQIDVTMALVDAFQPSARQRKVAIEIQKQTPIPLEQMEQHED